MKFKTPVFKELRGRLGHTLPQNDICFRTYKNFGIQVIKNPARKVDPAGSQWIYRHQIYYWSLHWNFLTTEEKKTYEDLGEVEGITGYDYYIKEKYDPKYLYVHPSELNWTEKAYPNTIHVPRESVLMSDDVTYEKHVYIKFPLDILLTKKHLASARLYFFYYEEAGFDADDKYVICYSIKENWDWRTLTWNNAPALHLFPEDDTRMPSQMNWFDFASINYLRKAIEDGDPWFGYHVRFRDLDPTTESMSGLRATRHHDNDFWPYLRLELQ